MAHCRRATPRRRQSWHGRPRLRTNPREGRVELLRAQRERPHALIINDPHPLASVSDIWGSVSQLALIGIFVVTLGAVFYVARPILLPILAALLIAMTFAPIIKRADRRNISPWLTATLIVIVLVAAVAVLVTLL